MKNRLFQFFVLVPLLLACVWPGAGCTMLKNRIVGPMAKQVTSGLMREDDIQLVQDGAPAFLLMLDSMALSHPDNRALLLAAADAQMAYATAFVGGKENQERAMRMYSKARDFGMQALLLNKKFARAPKETPEEFKKALLVFKKKDADAILLTGLSWALWMIANSDSPAAMGDLPNILAMIDRVLELKPESRAGAADNFYGIYYAVMPLGAGRDLERSRQHFEKSMNYAGPDYLLGKVVFAEYYARYTLDQELFESTLQSVLDWDGDAPHLTLMNRAAQIRAKALLKKVDDLF